MDLKRGDSVPSDESVTLLRYFTDNRGRHRSNSTQALNLQQPPIVKKSADKFFKTLRRRSKSASRIPSSKRTENQLNNSVNSEDSITYTANGEPARNPDKIRKQEKVTLVGFSTINNNNNNNKNQTDNNNNNSRFSTLKTSREVKMERERLRQERLRQLNSREWIEKVRAESLHFNNPDSLLFRSDFHQNSHERFQNFIRENQERFQSLLNEHQRFNAGDIFPSAESTMMSGGPPARDEDASRLTSTSSQQQQQQRSKPRIHRIEILNSCSNSDVSDNSDDLKRSCSTSSSSGFSSITSDQQSNNNNNNHSRFNIVNNNMKQTSNETVNRSSGGKITTTKKTIQTATNNGSFTR